MRKIYSFTIIVCLILVITGSLNAQSLSPQVINTTGGTATINNIKLDWSVGELPLVATMQNIIVVTNGFLQPFTETPGDINTDNNFGPEEIRVFPNPATSYIEINFLTRQKGTINIRLYNSMGQQVYFGQVFSNGVGNIERIDLQHLAPTEYFLQLVLDPAPGSVKKKGGYKIIKVR